MHEQVRTEHLRRGRAWGFWRCANKARKMERKVARRKPKHYGLKADTGVYIDAERAGFAGVAKLVCWQAGRWVIFQTKRALGFRVR